MNRMQFALWLENATTKRRSRKKNAMPVTHIRSLASAVRAAFKKGEISGDAWARSKAATDAGLQAELSEDHRLTSLRYRSAADTLDREGSYDLAKQHRTMFAKHIELMNATPVEQSLFSRPLAQVADMIARNPDILNKPRVGRKELDQAGMQDVFGDIFSPEDIESWYKDKK